MKTAVTRWLKLQGTEFCKADVNKLVTWHMTGQIPRSLWGLCWKIKW